MALKSKFKTTWSVIPNIWVTDLNNKLLGGQIAP
jgi:hypothetical protein